MEDFPFCLNNHVSIATEMMQTRLDCNRDNYDMLKQLLNEEAEVCTVECERLVGHPINVGSWKQVQTFLYGELGLKQKFKKGKTNPTTDENALRELRVEYPQYKEVLNAFIKERHINKKIESYIEIDFDEDGRIPYSANPAGTETNRWSFSKSPRGRGFNTQTAPKVMRLMVQSPRGRVFIAPDLPQADARIVAWDAECMKLIELFSDPTKHFHLENCIRLGTVPGSPFAGITREIAYGQNSEGVAWKDYAIAKYTTGKAMGHAANYRMQSKRLAMELGIELKDAKTLLNIYLFNLYPEIPRWHGQVLERVKHTGSLTTPWPFERQRVCYGAWGELMLRGKVSESTWNELCAHIPQSAVADIVNTGMERLWLNERSVWFHLHGHDSYLASVPGDDLGSLCKVALEALRVELRIHNRPLEMVPEMSVGTNYGQMVEWKGEETLRDLQPRLDAKPIVEKEVRKELYGYY